MKTLLLTILTSIFAAGFLYSTTPQPHHYVVIGAFAIKKNAERFIHHAEQHSLHARFEINPDRNLYYVYVLLTDDRNEAIQTALKLRAESPYHDTWVFKGVLGETLSKVSGEDINPVTQRTSEIVIADVPVPQEKQTSSVAEYKLVAGLPQNELSASISPVEIARAENVPAQRQVVFSLFRADNRTPIDGDVLAIDAERARKIASFDANRSVRIYHPGNQSGEMLFMTEVFGYRKVQRTFNFTAPQGDDLQTDSSGNLVIPFELVRLQKGDIAVMYNVYFFKDAAVMRPESRWELNNLLEMLLENPKYKIRIHGHTNGNAPGKIVSHNTKSGKPENFFSLTDTREGYGSAKKLSQERAEVIREYLLANGIDASRMQIKAWGGKRPVVDKLHTLAENNVRVEIEILEN
jgi:outer membrane protein OmpA-like peptidoglycan-associated protein